MNKNITIKDIAKLASVSVSTVSRVINHDPSVADATQKKVSKVINEYHYQPSMIARGMVSKKTNMIAVIVSDITNPYFNQFVAILEKRLLLAGYTLSLFDSQTALTTDKDSVLAIETKIVNQIRENHFDATIILGGLIDRLNIPQDYLKTLENLISEMPTIIVGRANITELPNSENLTYLNRDQIIPTKLLVNYMLKQKHHQFIFIGGNASAWITNDRTNTFKEVLLENNVPISDNYIFNNNFYFQDGYNAAKHVIQSQLSFDAVVAINDRVAMGFLRGIKDLTNLDFSEFALGSCEFFEENAFSIPRITSVDHNIEALSNSAAQLLIATLEKQSLQTSLPDITPKLILGESC